MPTEWFIIAGQQAVFAPLTFPEILLGEVFFIILMWLHKSLGMETTLNRNTFGYVLAMDLVSAVLPIWGIAHTINDALRQL